MPAYAMHWWVIQTRKENRIQALNKLFKAAVSEEQQYSLLASLQQWVSIRGTVIMSVSTIVTWPANVNTIIHQNFKLIVADTWNCATVKFHNFWQLILCSFVKTEPIGNEIPLVTGKLRWPQKRANDGVWILSPVNKNVNP